MVADYIRPTAMKTRVIKNDALRFGFHNFRHSLATFFDFRRTESGKECFGAADAASKPHRHDAPVREHGFRENRGTGSDARSHDHPKLMRFSRAETGATTGAPKLEWVRLGDNCRVMIRF